MNNESRPWKETLESERRPYSINLRQIRGEHCLYVYVFIYDSSLPLWLTFLQQKWLSKDPAALSIATFAFSSLEETSLISVGKTLLAAKLLESIWAVFVDKLSSKLCFE